VSGGVETSVLSSIFIGVKVVLIDTSEVRGPRSYVVLRWFYGSLPGTVGYEGQQRGEPTVWSRVRLSEFFPLYISTGYFYQNRFEKISGVNFYCISSIGFCVCKIIHIFNTMTESGQVERNIIGSSRRARI
jgi:hypothetical protein